MTADFDELSDIADEIPKRPRKTGGKPRLITWLAIIGGVLITVAMLLPAMRTAGPAARRAQCVNNLKQITLALFNYESAYKALPPAYTVDAEGKPLHSWRTLILPYLETQSLYASINLSKPWNDPANAEALKTEISVFRCPEADRRANYTTYLAVVTSKGCFRPDKPRPLSEITDAHGQTLMVIEAPMERAVPWMAPIDADEALVMAFGPNTKLNHAGGTNAANVDGSVQFLKASTTAAERRALISIAGNDNAAAEPLE